MKIKIDQSFLLGLYLFLRQLQLSIDRSLDSDWKELVEYFETRISIYEVLEKLKRISTIDFDNRAIGELTKPSFSTSLLSAVVGRQNNLSEEELRYIYSRLQVFSALSSSSDSPDRKTLVNLRLDLQSAEDLVSSRINKKDLVGKEYVEHFNQNETMDCKSVNDLVGSTWL